MSKTDLDNISIEDIRLINDEDRTITLKDGTKVVIQSELGTLIWCDNADCEHWEPGTGIFAPGNCTLATMNVSARTGKPVCQATDQLDRGTTQSK